MTQRELKITKTILDILHDLDGRQQSEVALHAEVDLACKCSLTEFEPVLRTASRNGWITGVPGRVTSQYKWNITDAGEAARLEMA